jgi:hypothetical protein
MERSDGPERFPAAWMAGYRFEDINLHFFLERLEKVKYCFKFFNRLKIFIPIFAK